MVRDLDIGGQDYRNGTVLADFYPNYTFTSPISGLVGVDGNGDRKSPYVIRTFSHNSLRYGVSSLENVTIRLENDKNRYNRRDMHQTARAKTNSNSKATFPGGLGGFVG